jgi:ABC-type uncharacterized transport system permease subunit
MSSPALPFFKTWLIFFLVSTLVGAGVGMLVGAIVGAVMGFMGFDFQAAQDLRTLQIASGVAGFLVGLPISFVVFRWAVMKYLLSEIQRPSFSDERNMSGW